ncbi:MAG: hypothetical protein LBT38_12285 [Deltaproteobacteria bacterium]|jgi:hypothetical protein|nr:hypothetical protein [Deltaproteobacteria bacterium]
MMTNPKELRLVKILGTIYRTGADGEPETAFLVETEPASPEEVTDKEVSDEEDN